MTINVVKISTEKLIIITLYDEINAIVIIVITANYFYIRNQY